MDTEMNLHPVQFVICGSPECDALNTKTDVNPDEIRNLKCYQCLDSLNSANLISNIDWFVTWRERMLQRCSPKPDEDKAGDKSDDKPN